MIFCSDHRLNDFPGGDHPEWEAKRELEKEARALAGDKTKVFSVYNGLFLEGAFGVSQPRLLIMIRNSGDLLPPEHDDLRH